VATLRIDGGSAEQRQLLRQIVARTGSHEPQLSFSRGIGRRPPRCPVFD